MLPLISRPMLARSTPAPPRRLLAALGGAVLLPLLAATPASSQGTPLDPAALQRRIEGPQMPDRQGFDGLTLTELMERFRVPGASVAVVHDFRIHWAKGYGTADVVSGAAVDTGTVFQAASISKPVAAMAALRAVQDGAFGLDEDVNGVLRSWQLDGAGFTGAHPVTPRTLMSHTSGLGDGFGFPGYPPGAPRPTVVQILRGEAPSNVGSVDMERPPLTYMKYSGGGVTVMQLALTDALGRPFEEILRESVLDPVGMGRSTYEQPLPPGWEANAARAHSGAGRAMDARWHVYPEQAAAGLWTTPSDLARFVIEVQRALRGEEGRVLGRDLQEKMITPVGVGSYAVGFAIEQLGEGWYFSHGGSNRGFRALLVGHVAKGYGLAIMTNADGGNALIDELRARIERAYGWDSLDKRVPR